MSCIAEQCDSAKNSFIFVLMERIKYMRSVLPSMGLSSNRNIVGEENTKLSIQAMTTNTLARFPAERKICL